MEAASDKVSAAAYPAAAVSPAMVAPTQQFAGFLGVGVASACLSLLTRYLTNQVVPFEVAVVVAHVVGMLFSFALNRRLIFPATSRPVHDELAKFALVNLLSLAIATAVSSLCYRIVLPALGVEAFSGLIAHVIGLAACAVPSFLGHKFFSFREASS